jgi:hypothetical protein
LTKTLARLGARPEARRVLRKTAALKPGSDPADAQLEIASVFEVLGDTQEAPKRIDFTVSQWLARLHVAENSARPGGTPEFGISPYTRQRAAQSGCEIRQVIFQGRFLISPLAHIDGSKRI